MSISIRIVSLAFILGFSAYLGAQRTGSNWPSPPPSAQQIPPGRRAAKANLEQLQQAAEQHKLQVQNDTQRLTRLVDDLRQDLDKTPAGVLSLDAVRKSKEIEKAAKHLRKELQQD